jgi:hypothetical protein
MHDQGALFVSQPTARVEAPAVDRLVTNGVAARHSSESNEHYTPHAVVEAARTTLGRFDLDPASCAFANETVRAAHFFTAEVNGFLKPWHGLVFHNPPGGKCDPHGRSLVPVGDGLKKRKKSDPPPYKYLDGRPCLLPSQASAKAWWFKLAEEFKSGRVEGAIFVGFSLELLQITQVDAPEGLPIPLDFDLCFTARRIAYIRGEDGKIGAAPPHSSVIVNVSRDAAQSARFAAAFSPIGRVRLAGA